MSEKDDLRKKFQEHAEKKAIHLNPDEKIVSDIIDKLLLKKAKFGETYCPCRFVSKNIEKDQDIVCPCVFHRGEIELQGHCLCTLFVK
jgi:ferredoxin-thioredoxin reductase catalytic chain